MSSMGVEYESSTVSERGKRKRSTKGEGKELVLYEGNKVNEWLPPCWRVERKVRTGGKTAGHIDTYYISPENLKFKSKKEVVYYLESGKRRTPNPKSKNKSCNANAKPSDSSGSSSKDFRDTCNKDFTNNSAEKAMWIVPSFRKLTPWTPFISDDMVPESVKNVWATAFASST